MVVALLRQRVDLVTNFTILNLYIPSDQQLYFAREKVERLKSCVLLFFKPDLALSVVTATGHLQEIKCFFVSLFAEVDWNFTTATAECGEVE